MGSLSDFEKWLAIPPEERVSKVPTPYKLMSEAEFQKNNDGSLDAMNRRALDSSGNVVLRIGLDVATSIGHNLRDISKE